MHFEPATPLFGAFVTDVDLRTIDDRAASLLEEAWAEYGVLFFRDQPLTPDEHIAFAERFAPIDVDKFFEPVDGHPRIAQVLKEADQTANIGGGWHTDHSYDQIPARGSILLAREVPPTGGDTRFLSVAAAYDALDESMKQRIAGLDTEASDALLTEPYQHIIQPEFSYQFRWEPGSIAMWDNRSTWYWALNDYDGHRRLMHRITVQAEPLHAAI